MRGRGLKLLLSINRWPRQLTSLLQLRKIGMQMKLSPTDDGQSAAAVAVPVAGAGFQVTEDWAAQTETSDCATQYAPLGETAAAPTTPAATWGGSTQW